METVGQAVTNANLDMLSALVGVVAYLVLAIVFGIVVAMRSTRLSGLWIAMSAFFSIRCVASVAVVWNHVWPIPAALTVCRLVSAVASVGVALFVVSILPDLLNFFRTRTQELKMNTEVLSEIDKAQSLSATLAEMTRKRTVQMMQMRTVQPRDVA